MGKQGPCYHCGVTSTPLWRNGPPDKPILCNACGSRWRTKGTLVNYTPLHARAEPDDFDYHRVQKVKSISLKNKDSKLLKRKLNHENAMVGGFAPDYNTGFRKVLEEDTSNRSSSGSAISNSDSCMQFGSAEASDLTGPAQSNVWDSKVPSWKRTCVNRPKQSPVEKLAKDLHTILHEQQSYLSGSSEEDLLFESDTPMVSVEIGHGSVLIRHPSSMAREEESEASSLSVDNKRHAMNEAYSRVTTLPVHNNYHDVNFSSRGTDKSKKPIGQEMEPDQIRRDKSQGEKQQIIGNRNSPLCYIDLKDVLNFEEFASQLTSEEQQHLLKYLPFVDTARLPENLKSMFDSPQFSENLSSFQKLLAEGVFDLSVPVEKSEGYKMLKKFTLFNLTKSKWVEQYNVLQDGNCEYSSGGGSVVAEARSAIPSGHSGNAKRSRDCKFQNIPGEKSTMRSPKRVFTKANYGNNESMENDGSCFSPRSLFALPPDHSSLMLNSFQYVEESSDQDLLLDVPSHSSFPQAELLLPTTFASQASTSSSSVYQNSFRP